VIDDPDFAEVSQADDDLIEVGVVIDGIEVRPVGIGAPSGNDVVVDVHAFGMRGDVA
jgi:hypothetical protein